MTETDPTDIAAFVTVGAHPLWAVVQESLTKIFGIDNSSLVLHWLLGQVASPLTPTESAHQADQLSSALNANN
jgi:hypothetical protein